MERSTVRRCQTSSAKETLSAVSSPSAAFAALHTFSSTSLSLESMVFLGMSAKWVSPVTPFSKSRNPSRSTSCHADSLQSTYDLS